MNAQYGLFVFCLLLSSEGCQLAKAVDPIKRSQQTFRADDNKQGNRTEGSRRLSKEEALSVVQKDITGNKRRPENYNYVFCEPEELWVWRIVVDPKDGSANEEATEYVVLRTGPKVVATKSLPLNMTVKEENEARTGVNTREEAIALARKDAVKVHSSLNEYKIVVGELQKAWRVVFALEDSTGGGPAYVIDKRTGKIIQKIEYQ